ncbi:endonuclease/exonuclease/phosphatase family protein [Rubrivivax sp. A210]|uniref:endonuclease/exonuclease/phosphatase family protein n=1 Tax=Rubrivivax sp. A210 TaxID=2772301 RepID=UPI00191A0586|nr:endonuclease/exonuclease/phosphatase family protein [Rubrivivax sp. A210]
MRLVTWNACKGQYLSKSAHLAAHNADIAVIQEIAKPREKLSNVLWFGENENQGVAIIAKDPYTIEPLIELPNAPKYFVPIKVNGPTNFTLFAVWTLGAQPHRYVRAASVAIDMYDDLFAAGQTVLMGDFNSNAIWDTDHPKDVNHSAMLRRLERHGLVSAYHHHLEEEHGSEKQPTFYYQWNEAKPFHIDYCFMPRTWATKVSRVEVGDFEAWRERSDHRPLFVEVAVEA